MMLLLLERACQLYLEPRGIKAEDASIHLAIAASNQFELFDCLQERLKCRFGQRDWKLIEQGLQHHHEDLFAAETVVQALLTRLARRSVPAESADEWKRLVARLNKLTHLERHALADAGIKARAFPGRGIFNLLGSQDVGAPRPQPMDVRKLK
jgi:hypothetical protein